MPGLSDENGLYEQQDPEQPVMNLRGKFRSDNEGRYCNPLLAANAQDIVPMSRKNFQFFLLIGTISCLLLPLPIAC